ncbi:class I SAM-dependent methyltransferase [Nocardia sp. NPDC052566]|uniref:class I SAM-dependent methyltransferase n=1 Tax=Nocardia sp. NPDC052566 TaxID=3364330 RepID=UPI0037CBF751
MLILNKARTAIKHVALSVRGQYSDVRDDYQKVAGTYDEYYSHNLEAAAQQFRRLLPWEELKRPNLNVVELAAGTGAITKTLSEALSADSVLTAVDISEAMLAENRRKTESHRGTNFVVGDAVEYLVQQPADSVDALVCAWGVCYMPHPKLKKELTRVLKPGAFLGIMENRKGTLKELESILLDVITNDPRLLRKAVRLELPKDSAYIAQRIVPDGARVAESFDSESARTVADTESILAYVTKSGVASGYLDAIAPDLYEELIEGLRIRIDAIGPRNVPIVHRYSIVTANV